MHKFRIATTMKQHNPNQQTTLIKLISEYEAMSQKGTVGFFEEKVFFDFIEYYSSENAFDKALEVVDHALSQHYYSSDLLLCKARLLMDEQQVEAALICVDQAYALSPSDIDVQLLRSELLCILGQHNEALEVLNGLPVGEVKDTPKDIFLYKAFIHERLSDFDQMFDALKASLLHNPSNERVLKKILFCVEVAQKYEESVKFHKQLIDLDPYSYLAWYNLGHAYNCLDNNEKAADAFEYAFLANPQFMPAYKEFAATCCAYKAYDRALQAYETLLDHMDADSDVYTSIGACYEYKDDYEVAHVFYLKAISLDQSYSNTYFRIGECNAKQKKWDEAIQAYKKAITLDRRREEYFAALGEAYFQIGEDEKALPCFQQAADIAPELSMYWLQYALFLMETEAYDEAIDVLEEAGMYTADAELEYCKAACYFKKGEARLAKKQLAHALINYYDKHTILFNFVPTLNKNATIIGMINIYNQN